MANKANKGSFSANPETGRLPIGRPKGSQNKTTALIKNTFLTVFQALQQPLEDGTPNPSSLIEWGQRDPEEFYKIVSKIIPLEIEQTVRKTIIVDLVDDDTSETEVDIEEVDFEDAEGIEDVDLSDLG